MTKNLSKSKTEGKTEKTETAYIVDGYEVKKERVLSRLNSMSKVTIDLMTDLYGRDLDYVIAEKIRKEDADEEEQDSYGEEHPQVLRTATRTQRRNGSEFLSVTLNQPSQVSRIGHKQEMELWILASP